MELLSIAAITYYLVSLLSYLLKGVKSDQFSLDKDVILAISIPVIAVALFMVLKLVRKHMDKE